MYAERKEVQTKRPNPSLQELLCQLQVSENGLVGAKGDLLACGNENFRGAAPGRSLELILPTHSSTLA